MSSIKFSLLFYVALVVIQNGPAFGENHTDVVIHRATGLYADLEFEKATKLLQQALIQPGNSRAQLIKLYHLRGLCLSSLGNKKAAQITFSKLLALNPTFRLGNEVSPRVRDPFEELLRSNPQPLDIALEAPPIAQVGKPTVWLITVRSNPIFMAKSIKLFFRGNKSNKFSSSSIEIGKNGKTTFSISSVLWSTQTPPESIAWYAVLQGEHAAKLIEFGDNERPHLLKVQTEASQPDLVAPAPWYSRWWVWTLVGGVAVAATTTAVVLVNQKSPSGPFDFTVDFSTSR